jgi:glycosyltransferase involved in cell wall biosynthesis
MKKILIINPPMRGLPALRGGGIEKFVFDLGVSLSKNGFKIEIVCIRDIKNIQKTKFPKNNFVITEIEVPDLPFFRGFIYNLKIFLNYLFLRGSCLIIVNDISQILAPLLLKSINKRISNLFIVHNIRPWFRIKKYNTFRDLSDIILGIISLRFSDKIVSFTNLMKDYITTRFLITKDKISVIPPGISRNIVKKFPIKTSEERAKINKFEILNIGRPVEEKGLRYLLYALSRVQKKYQEKLKIILRVIGQQKESLFTSNDFRNDNSTFLNNIKEIIMALNLKENVIFMGELNNEEVLKILEESDMFISPTLGETFNYSALESLAVGTPVIISNRAGIAEYLENRENSIFINPTRIDRMAEIISQMIKKQNIGKKLVIKGKQLVLEQFVWQKIINKYIKIIKDLLKIKENQS